MQAHESLMQYIEQQTGINLSETSCRQVSAYLNDRRAALGLNLDGFVSRLKADRREREAFFDAVTINETYFFREEKHFRALESHIFPFMQRWSTRPLLFWSAACSTGEEAISISALAARHWNYSEFRTYASDINTNALAHLQRGEYGKNAFREDGRRFHHLLGAGAGSGDGLYRVPAELSGTIVPRYLNLSETAYEGVPEGLHLIFLRNMMIYVKYENRIPILDRLVSLMAEGGYLFLSSSEVPLLGHPYLVLENCCGCYYFRKKTLQEKKDGVKPCSVATAVTTTRSPERMKPLRIRPAPPRVEEILRHVGQRLNNPVYQAGDDPSFLAALACLEAVCLLNSSEPAAAGKAIDDLAERWGENEITCYLKGLVALRCSRIAEAKQWFEAALRRGAGFWPAQYQLAIMLQAEEPEKALRCFVGCKRSIDTYISRGAFTYQFLLDGFSARHFDSVCQGWITRLRGKGAVYGT